MSKELEALEELKVVEIDTCIESQDRFDSNIEIVERALKALEFIRKCFYVAKSSGAILLTSYGFEHKEELKEALL